MKIFARLQQKRFVVYAREGSCPRLGVHAANPIPTTCEPRFCSHERLFIVNTVVLIYPNSIMIRSMLLN